MKDLGLNQKSAKAVAFMALAPAALAGMGAFVGTPIMKAIISAFGVDEPEEWVYSKLYDAFGEYGENFGRFGLFGLAGVSLKGSLQIGITDIPTSLADVLGAPGSLVSDIWQGGKSVIEGDVLRGIERMLPLALASPMKAYRESTEGVTTQRGVPVFHGPDPLVADTVDSIYRFFSFNPARIAGIRERQWHERKVEQDYLNRRKDIYARFVRYFRRPGRTKKELIDLLAEVRQYNNRVMENGLTKKVPFIKRSSIKAALKRALVPSRRERLRRVSNY